MIAIYYVYYNFWRASDGKKGWQIMVTLLEQNIARAA